MVKTLYRLPVLEISYGKSVRIVELLAMRTNNTDKQ